METLHAENADLRSRVRTLEEERGEQEKESRRVARLHGEQKEKEARQEQELRTRLCQEEAKVTQHLLTPFTTILQVMGLESQVVGLVEQVDGGEARAQDLATRLKAAARDLEISRYGHGDNIFGPNVFFKMITEVTFL